jgi:diaminopimelate epimerase
MRLSKWQALGNDYLLVEPGELTEPLRAERVRFLCDYHYGVGSDGVLEITGVDDESVDLRIWNPDGSRAELSGNGARIAIAWAARRSGTGRVRLRLGDRVVEGEADGDGGVELRVGDVEVGETEALDVEGEPVELTRPVIRTR